MSRYGGHDLDHCPRDGEWVRFRLGPWLALPARHGVGQVLFCWAYDGVFVEIKTTRGQRVSVHIDERLPYGSGEWFMTSPKDSLEFIEEPVMITEGIGL